MNTIIQTDNWLTKDQNCFDNYWKKRIVEFGRELVERAPAFGWGIHGDLNAALDPEPIFEGSSHEQRLYAEKLFRNVIRYPDCKKRINHFYRFFFRTFLPGKVMLFVAKPGKRADVQVRRNAWVTMRDYAESLRLAYVEEKGDFYKQ